MESNKNKSEVKTKLISEKQSEQEIKKQVQKIEIDQQGKIDYSFKGANTIIPPNEKGVGGLYLSNYHFAENLDGIQEKQIGAVVTAMLDSNIQFPADMKINHKLVEIQDDEAKDMSQHFDSVIQFIKENLAKTNVLIHCAAGISRSATLTIAYLMQSFQLTFEKAHEWVLKKRCIIEPNEGFVKQLKKFQTVVLSNDKPVIPINGKATSLSVNKQTTAPVPSTKPSLQSPIIKPQIQEVKSITPINTNYIKPPIQPAVINKSNSVISQTSSNIPAVKLSQGSSDQLSINQINLVLFNRVGKEKVSEIPKPKSSVTGNQSTTKQ